MWRQHVGVATAWRAAQHAYRSDCRLVEHDGRDTGTESGILGMSDGDAGDIGQQIASHAILLEQHVQTNRKENHNDKCQEHRTKTWHCVT